MLLSSLSSNVFGSIHKDFESRLYFNRWKRYFSKNAIIVLLLVFALSFIWLNFFYTTSYILSLNPWHVANSIPNDVQPHSYKKYVNFECNNRQLCGGLVDRFKGIINAYTWSLFTKRTLVITITKPCYFEYLMIPNQLNWNLNLSKLVENGDLRKNYTQFEINRIDDFGWKDELAKTDLINYHKDKDVISIYSNNEWTSGFTRNENLSSFIQEWGFKPIEFHFSQAFLHWFNKLFKLHPDVEKKFQPYLKKAKPIKKIPLICVQIRIGGKRPNVAYDREITPRSFTVHYWDFVRKNLTQGMSDFRMFVTADTEAVEREAVNEFGENKVVVIDGVSAHMDREADFGPKCSRFDKIAMDFWMLGYCDMAIVSDSGFGIFGILRTKIPEDNYYVLTALLSNYKKADISKLKDFIYANPTRY